MTTLYTRQPAHAFSPHLLNTFVRACLVGLPDQNRTATYSVLRFGSTTHEHPLNLFAVLIKIEAALITEF